MIESFYKTFEDFIVEFSSRRLAGALLLAIVGLGGFAILDRYTPYFSMGRLERATGLLERLSALDAGGRLSAQKDLQELRSDIITEVHRLVQPGPLFGTSGAAPTAQVALWKFAAGVAPWLLLALAYLPNVRTDPSNWNGVMGAFFMAVLFGFLALFIPSAWATWGTLIGYSLGHFILVVVVVLVWQASKSAREKKPAG